MIAKINGLQEEKRDFCGEERENRMGFQVWQRQNDDASVADGDEAMLKRIVCRR